MSIRVLHPRNVPVGVVFMESSITYSIEVDLVGNTSIGLCMMIFYCRISYIISGELYSTYCVWVTTVFCLIIVLGKLKNLNESGNIKLQMWTYDTFHIE